MTGRQGGRKSPCLPSTPLGKGGKCNNHRLTGKKGDRRAFLVQEGKKANPAPEFWRKEEQRKEEKKKGIQRAFSLHLGERGSAHSVEAGKKGGGGESPFPPKKTP